MHHDGSESLITNGLWDTYQVFAELYNAIHQDSCTLDLLLILLYLCFQTHIKDFIVINPTIMGHFVVVMRFDSLFIATSLCWGLLLC